MVTKCTCKHEYQDVVYGANNRVHTVRRVESDGTTHIRCTVCSNEKRVNKKENK